MDSATINYPNRVTPERVIDDRAVRAHRRLSELWAIVRECGEHSKELRKQASGVAGWFQRLALIRGAREFEKRADFAQRAATRLLDAILQDEMAEDFGGTK